MRNLTRSAGLLTAFVLAVAAAGCVCPDFPGPTECQVKRCKQKCRACPPRTPCGPCADPCAKDPCGKYDPCSPKQFIQVRSVPGVCLDICGAPVKDMCTGPCPEVTSGPEYYFKLPITTQWYARWTTEGGDCVFGRIEVGDWSYDEYRTYVHHAQLVVPLTDTELSAIIDRQEVLTKVLFLPDHVKIDCLRRAVDKITQLRAAYGDSMKMDMSDTMRRNWSYPMRSEYCVIAAFGGIPQHVRPEFIDQLVAWRDTYLVDLAKHPQGRSAGWWVWSAQNHYLDDIGKRTPGPGEPATVGTLPPAADPAKVADLMGSRLLTVRLGPAQHPF